MAYISPWLTHFVGRNQSAPNAQFDVLHKILRERCLGQWEQQGNVHISPGGIHVPGGGSLCKDEFIRSKPVCFCDIPEEDLERHTGIYGAFGLAFDKGFLVSKGANPVFYVAKGSVAGLERPQIPTLTIEDLEADGRAALGRYLGAMNAEPMPVRRCEFFDRLVVSLMGVLPPPWPAGTPADAQDPVREVQQRVLWDLIRHVFAFTKFFDESLSEEHVDNFYMEREWRVSGFVEFELADIKKVYVAPGFRERIELEFPGVTVKEF